MSEPSAVVVASTKLFAPPPWASASAAAGPNARIAAAIARMALRCRMGLLPLNFEHPSQVVGPHPARLCNGRPASAVELRPLDRGGRHLRELHEHGLVELAERPRRPGEELDRPDRAAVECRERRGDRARRLSGAVV